MTKAPSLDLISSSKNGKMQLCAAGRIGLGNNTFKAKNWFNSESEPAVEEMEIEDSLHMSELLSSLNFNSQKLPSTNPALQTNQGFTPAKYFQHGWLGNELLSKNGTELHKILNYIDQDVKERFRQLNTNKIFKQAIYSEFLTFAEEYALSCPELDNYQTFWNQLVQQDSKQPSTLNSFFKLYCSRVSIVFFCKIRFISTLARESNLKISNKDLLHTSSFFTSLFRKNGATELKSEAIQSNQYSWYNPSSAMIDIISAIPKIIEDATIDELLEIISKHKKISTSSKMGKSFITELSHELSHKNFGNFLTSMILSIPQWLDRNIENKSRNSFKPKSSLDVITCKFSGDHLESFSKAHLLAQESNKFIRWKQIICPEFTDPKFQSGQFLKIIFELQFLTFLAANAKIQNNDPHTDVISFICNIFDDIKTNQTVNSPKQRSFMLPDSELLKKERTYDRIVLNLIDLPKRNPHNFLTNRISKEAECLKDSGHIIIFSSQKLFVPSQKIKINQLLQNFRLECCFTLKHLSGIGKIAPFIYVFAKRNETLRYQTDSLEDRKKQPCLSFRVQGSLTTINDLSSVIYELEHFLHQHGNTIPPLFFKELDNFKFDFHKDAIVDGRLVNFTSNDSSKITHPTFFNKLLKTCTPLGNFFTIKKIEAPENEFNKNNFDNLYSDTNSIFGNGYFNKYYPYVIIVDLRDPNTTNLELIPYDAFKSKSSENGFTLCHYFGLFPKLKTINLNLFREFFNSTIGRQLIDLTFTERNHKLKEKLSSLLLPIFFSNQTEMPLEIEKGLSLLYCKEEDILNKHPEFVKQEFARLENVFQLLKTKYPHKIMGTLSFFANTISNCMESLSGPTSCNINFTNPLIQKPLMNVPSKTILPENEDVYVDLHSKLMSSPLTRHKINHYKAGNQNVSSVELYSKDELIASMHTDRILAEFISYIIPKAYDYPIAAIIQGVQIPSLKDMKKIVDNYQSIKDELNTVHQKCSKLINSIFIEQISL